MDYKKSRRLLHILCLGGLAFCLLNWKSEQIWPIIVCIVLVAAGIIQYAVFCRCPHCGALFNSRVRLPHYCPECGKELE